MAHQLRFAPEILVRLGEELVPHADLGIMELVRNAYDADASTCHIQLSSASQPGGVLIVDDDGDGMNANDLASGFLLIGKSNKPTRASTDSGRRKVGEKGLGRLAALRLGTHVTITTRSAHELGHEHILTIDWDLVDSAEAVEDVPLNIDTRRTDKGKGTTVTISNLRREIDEREAERLARSVLLLTGPFADATSFLVTCDTPEFTTLSRVLASPLLEWVEYKLTASLDTNGQMRASLNNWRGDRRFAAEHHEITLRRSARKKSQPRLAFSSPPATFEMWMFNLNPGAGSKASKEVRFAQQPTPEIKNWLKNVGGIHLYHRELRVQPYGDPANDWLGINLRRSASPELRPSTNNSVGRIQVSDPDNLLKPKTDRSGFVENLAFIDLQEFARCALEWASEKRLEEREQSRVGAATKARNRVREAESKFKNILDAIGDGDSDTLFTDAPDPAILRSLKEGATEVFETLQDENRALREDLLLYRSLATVGTSTAVFAHEALKPAARIINEVKTVSRRIRKLLTPQIFDEEFRDSIDISLDSAMTLETFARLPLSLLEKNKREVSDIDMDAACRAVVKVFARYLDERSIDVVFDLNSSGHFVRTTTADVEAILSNLIANSAHAFTREDARTQRRTIRLRTRVDYADSVTGVTVCCDDSGPGIQGLSVSAIWLPGKTTKDNGTGLGLTIVRDIVGDLRGRAEARVSGELGGARILIWLPAHVPEEREKS